MKDEDIWCTDEGALIYVSDLTTEHIFNILGICPGEYWVKILKEELESRQVGCTLESSHTSKV